MKRIGSCVVGAMPLVAALVLLVPNAAAAGKGHGEGLCEGIGVGSGHGASPHLQPTSDPLGFWYGNDMPAAEGKIIHDALAVPGGPIRQLINKLRSEDLNPERAKGVQQYKPSKSYEGYTLLSSLLPYANGGGALLVDMEGNIVKRWDLSSFPAKLLPGGSVMGYRGTGRPGYGDYGRLVQLDWCDNGRANPALEEWSYGEAAPGQNPAWGVRGHHDYQREGASAGYYTPCQSAITDGTGKSWVLVHREPDPALTTAVSDIPLQDDAILEVNPDGTIGWQWNAYEHIEQMGFSAVARQAIRTNKVANVDGTIAETDWQHFNAVSLLGPNRWYADGDERFHPDNILWDGRSTNIIAIVARHDDPQGRWASGDIVWRAGPDYSDPANKDRIGQIIGQHTAHMIPAGLPGAGNILVFDNGGIAGFGSLFPGLPGFWPVALRSYSRAIEFNPVTMEKVWEYTQQTDERANGGDRKFFSWFISSVQRLPNGNTLIAEGHDGRVFEVTRAGEIVWEYYPTACGPDDPKPCFRDRVGYIYRAYRYPASYLPLDRACE